MRSLVEATTDPDSAMNSMDRVRVTGRLVLDDRTHGTKTIFSNTDLSFDRASDGAVALSVAADGPSGRWSLVARAAAAPDGIKILTVEANDLSLDEITLAGGLRGVGFDFDMPLSAQLTIKLGSDGEIDTAKGSFSLGAGYFKLDDPDHEPLLIDNVAGGFHLDPTTNGVAIDRTELRAGESVFSLTGHVDLPRSPGDPWAVRADASGTFGTERPGEKPIRIAHAGMAFRVVPGEHRFVVDKLDVAGPEIDFGMTSDLHAEGSGFRLKNLATVKHMPAQALVRLWPSFIAGAGQGLASGEPQRRNRGGGDRDLRPDRRRSGLDARRTCGGGRPCACHVRRVEPLACLHAGRAIARRDRGAGGRDGPNVQHGRPEGCHGRQPGP